MSLHQDLVNRVGKFEYSVSDKHLLHCKYFLRLLLHVLTAKVYLLDLVLHQAVPLAPNVPELYLANRKLQYFSLPHLHLTLLIFMLLAALALRHLVLFHQLVDGLERFAFFVQLSRPFRQLFTVLATQSPYFVLVN